MTSSEVSTGPKRTRSADSEDWPPSPQLGLRDPDDLYDDLHDGLPDGLRPPDPTETPTWPVCSGEMRSLSLSEAGWRQAKG